MGLVCIQGEGQGMRISGKGRSIRMKISRINGDYDNPCIVLKVTGLPGCSGLEFSASHGYVGLVDRIKVKVGYQRDGYNVKMEYDTTTDYNFTEIKPPRPSRHKKLYRRMKSR